MMHPPILLRECRRGLPAALVGLLLSAGCLQVDTRVKVNKDGSATVTERIQFSRRLLDLAEKQKAGKNLERFLSKEHILERVGQMGKGAKLVRHEVRDGEKGARECVSVIQIPDLSNLRYTSPFLASSDYPKHTVLAFSLRPILKSHWHYQYWAGRMAVHVGPATKGRPSRGGAPAKPMTPAQLQVFRDLRPVFRDILQGFRVRLVVESYAPVYLARGYFRYRGERSATREYDLVDFSWKDFDRYGRDFLNNEEIMLELLRFQLSGGDLMATIKQHAANYSVPVYHPHGIPAIVFRPSRELFDRHFKGKKLDFGKQRGGTRMANWKEIGFQDIKSDTGSKKNDRKETGN
jgi:hypothetical protein